MKTTYIANTTEADNLYSGKQTAIVTLVKPPKWCKRIELQGGDATNPECYSMVDKNGNNAINFQDEYLTLKDFIPYAPGQTIAVRERYGNYALDNPNCSAAYWMYAADYPIGAKTYEYPDGDDDSVTCDFPIWRSPVTMPREAVRTWLLVKDVMCVRVQNMSSEQAQAIWPGMTNIERMQELHRKFGSDAWENNVFIFITTIEKNEQLDRRKK